MDFCRLETDSLLLSAVVLGVNCSIRGMAPSPCVLPFCWLNSLSLSLVFLSVVLPMEGVVTSGMWRYQWSVMLPVESGATSMEPGATSME